jgi:hypothetical protein
MTKTTRIGQKEINHALFSIELFTADLFGKKA